MTLPENQNPTGRDLAAFAAELRQARSRTGALQWSGARERLISCLGPAASAADDLATLLFGKEARQAIADEAEFNAAHTAGLVACLQQLENEDLSAARPVKVSAWPINIPPGTRTIFVKAAHRPGILWDEDGPVIIPAK